MRPTLILVVITIVTIVVATVMAALSRYKKAGSGEVKLIGELGTVEAGLAPEGTVIVRGELWRARANDGSAVCSHTRVRVVGFKDLLALVEVCD